ncbi:MAG: flagellar hook capping FlgD N-terminal domain-containing protein [Rhodospirillales bacterium]
MILGGVSGSTSADPNTQAGQAQQKLNEDLNQFLTLLITQLENQDPLDPMDSGEFTTQLVQFASVEQQIQQNANLEQLISLQSANLVTDMTNLLDTTIEATGQNFPLEGGQAEFTYALANNARETTVSIRNSAGLTVFTTPGEISAGKHNFVWDGKDSLGNTLPDGQYTAIVNAKNIDGNLMDVSHTVFGRVTGAGVENSVLTLFLGTTPVSMDSLLSIKENPKAPGTGSGS